MDCNLDVCERAQFHCTGTFSRSHFDQAVGRKPEDGVWKISAATGSNLLLPTAARDLQRLVTAILCANCVRANPGGKNGAHEAHHEKVHPGSKSARLHPRSLARGHGVARRSCSSAQRILEPRTERAVKLAMMKLEQIVDYFSNRVRPPTRRREFPALLNYQSL